ncbi:MAG: D-proline reductase (dithiol) proprotein PrdA [Oscillospiraceae bacterium]|jgi:D-proline reductase (dithiol) PrdA|nr:D-proline reductase (dithiol) proprotein PrdA [Oscillospiraceae bacterium]
MSISRETANAHLQDPAVLCCLTRAGTVVSPAELEDPEVFADLVDSGLLKLDGEVLKISQVLGATLKKDCDGLTPLTADLLDEIQEAAGPTAVAEEAPAADVKPAASVCTGGMVHLHLEHADGLTLDFPAGFSVATAAETPCTDKLLRTLVKKGYPVKEVRLSDTTSYSDGILSIDKDLTEKAVACNPLVKEVTMDVIPPEKRHVYSNTIMDVIPIAAKAEGKLGEGTTNVLTGAVFVLTGMDEAGVQIHEFGSCEGYMDEKIRFGRPGCPDPDDIMIRVDVKIQQGTGMERRGPFAAHCACDTIISEIREKLKDLSAEQPVQQETFRDVKRLGRPRVVLVKEIMGQGAMHDNLLVPNEPCGVMGGQKNVDLGNVPVVLSANEVLDGGVHALACIGPATKEITRHFFREPLVKALAADEELDLVGVVFIGSPQVNDEKTYVSQRLGALVEALDVEGAIVTTEGFGNNHIDFSENIAAIGSRGVPVVGVTFAAYQGQLVVGNQYMDAMIELNKDPEGFENEILGDNTTCPEDAARAVLMLKTKMAGVPIAAPERKWNAQVIRENQALVSDV